MLAFVGKRCFYLLIVLFILSVVVFSIIYLIPGDPALALLGDTATPEMLEALRSDMGLHRSVFEQYGLWIVQLLQGDLGQSYALKQPVWDAIVERLSPTLSIAVLAQGIAIVIAIPLGLFAASRPGTAADRTVRGFTLLGMTVPSFLLGLFMMLLFAVQLKWLPVSGYKPISAGFGLYLKHLIMPSVALGIIHSALLSRITRSAMLEVLGESYIRTARAKGVRESRIVYWHGLRNALMPIVTVIGQSFGALIAGAAVVESIFNIPGLGQLLVNSVQRRDYAVIQGVVLFVATLTVLLNLLVDLLYAVIDPRVRLNR